VPLSQWDQHEDELDLVTAEYRYQQDISLIPSADEVARTESMGVYEEKVHHDTLTELLQRDPPLFATEELQKTWITDMQRLQEMERIGTQTEDGALVFTTRYHKKYGLGRRVGAHPTLQSCPKKYRGPLASRYVHDLDIENAHYAMMMQIAQRHDSELPCVKYYVSDRDECLKRAREFYGCSREAAKQLYLSLLNGGDTPKWMFDFKISKRLRDDLRDGRVQHLGIVQQLRQEYATIQRVMFEAYPGEVQLLMDRIKRDVPQKPRRFCSHSKRMLDAEDDGAFDLRVRRSTFSTLLQNEEDRVLMSIVKHMQASDYTVRTLIYDGCLIGRKSDEPLSDELIVSCERAVQQDTSYQLKLWEKCLHCGQKLSQCVCDE
jgi:hypothetical protein